MIDRSMDEDPRLLNPFGELISIPVWLIINLKKKRMLGWNREHKRYQILPNVYPLLFMESNSSGFVHKPLRSQNFSNTGGGRSKDSGNPNPILQALGADCRGLNVSTEQVRRLADTYRDPQTAEEREFDAEYVVNKVRERV